jgi:hypothetical protein
VLSTLAIVLAMVAALGGASEAPPPLRRTRALRLILGGLVAGAGLLAAVVALRPAAGLVATVAEEEQPKGVLPAGPVDVIGRDPRALSQPRLRLI